MPRLGYAFERLIAALERALADSPSLTIEVNVRLPNRVTGQLREHDVVLRFRHRHHELVTALECRDRSRPVGVPEVEAFSAKCENTVDKGIMVSSAGFAETALEEARVRGIGCLALEEAERFDWILAAGFTVQTAIPQKPHLQVNTALPADWVSEVHHRELGRVEGEVLKTINQRCWLASRRVSRPAAEDEVGVLQHFSARVSPSEFYAVDVDGREVPVSEVIFSCDFVIEERVEPLQFHIYGDARDPDQRYPVVSAQVKFAGFDGHTRMIRLPDGRISVSFDTRSKSEDSG